MLRSLIPILLCVVVPASADEVASFSVEERLGQSWTNELVHEDLQLPKGAPADIVRTLHDAAVATLDTPAVQERLDQIGAAVVAPERQSPDYLQNFVESEIKKWGAAFTSANIHLE